MQPERHGGFATVDAKPLGDSASAAWLRAMLIGAVVLPVLAFLAIAWWGLRQAQADAQTTAENAAAIAEAHARRTFEVALDVARATAALTDADDAEVRRKEVAYRQRLSDMTFGLPSIVNMNVWDADGRVLVRSDQPADPQASVADRSYFRDQRDPAFGIGFSDVLIGRQTRKELMNLVIRRPSVDGSFRGVVAVSLSPEFFREQYRGAALGDKRLASLALVRQDGTMLARFPPAPDGRMQVPRHHETFQRMRRGEWSATYSVPAEGGREARIISLRRVGDHPIYVVAGISRAAMFADWSRFLTVLAAVIVPIAAGLVIVTLVALRRTRIEHAMALALRDEVRRRSAAENAMLESQKLETLAALSGGVAHDFNNLLAIIDTSLHVHRRRHAALADEPQMRAMARAVRAGVRLTRQLLSFARKQALNPETIDLPKWLPAAAELVGSTLGGRIECVFEVEPDTRPIWVDAAELELALINLALNAKHAMPDGGRFRVRARNTQVSERGEPPIERVVIESDDTGLGIPADVLPRVTEPFFTTRANGHGSGLGLSQVHGLCEQAGGFLRISSEVGQGTSIRMYFPIAPADVTAAPPPTQAQTPRLVGTVLLVEDNEDVARSTEALLLSAGLTVVMAKSADDALAVLASRTTPPDVVLSDIEMPGSMTGIGLAFKLRKERPGLPVLLTTGYANQIALAVAGGFEVLPKPTPPDSLMRRLTELIAPPPAAASALGADEGARSHATP